MSVLIQIHEYLKGLDFPVSREEVIRYAKDHDAPDMIIRVLEKITEKTYDSANEVVAETVGKVT